MMVLYSGTTCPFSHRCRFVLFEKGMDFEIRDVETAKTVLKLIEALDDHDDVQNVSANVTIPDEALAAIAAE